MKICFKCNTKKEYDCFYKHPGMADGYLGKCKECCKKYAKNRLKENPEKVREIDKKRSKTLERRAYTNKVVCKWNIDNPEGYRAHYMVSNAIRDGILTRQPCRVCGNPKSHAHHNDYNQPFEVDWLCAVHHSEYHHTNN